MPPPMSTAMMIRTTIISIMEKPFSLFKYLLNMSLLLFGCIPFFSGLVCKASTFTIPLSLINCSVAVEPLCYVKSISPLQEKGKKRLLPATRLS
jgi:hypothetical protein